MSARSAPARGRQWDGPVICTSVKGDVVAATLAGRQRRGRCWVYDPTGAAVAVSQSWSPLGDCVTWDGVMRIAAWLCEATQARLDSVTDGDYWYTQARKALAPYLHAVAIGGQTNPAVRPDRPMPGGGVPLGSGSSRLRVRH